ncbi:hypothetical protein MTR_6g055940 [Medicago truncatula]|uniref:Uncharacterized protein n=1 Tax=Medicago truncatula TaxID=3880 RepID=A0A072U9X2_MEDTR|nr:hypothetical protein MTR_6g055940 [Medicago truncatula]
MTRVSAVLGQKLGYDNVELKEDLLYACGTNRGHQAPIAISINILPGHQALIAIERKLHRVEHKAPGHQAPNNEMLMHGLKILNILEQQPLI